MVDFLHRGMVIQLPYKNNQYIIVALLEQQRYGWNCMVVGGNNPIYKPGGFDIMVFMEELRQGYQITLQGS